MARKPPEIKVISYVRKGDELVRFDDLSKEEREKIATDLKIRWLNALFAGQAVFAAADGVDTTSGDWIKV